MTLWPANPRPPFPLAPRASSLSKLALLAAACAWSGCAEQSVPPPTGYRSLTHGTKEFQCQVPQGWSIEEGGRSPTIWAKVGLNNAMIEVRTHLATAASQSIDPMQEATSSGRLDIDAAHQEGKQEAEARFNNYTELGEAETFTSPLGRAKRSEFTATKTLGAKLHGYRATILARDLRYNITCYGSDADWTHLGPAFVKVLESFKRG